MRLVLVFLSMPVLLLSLPVMLPIVAILQAREQRQRQRVAQRSVCVRCGATLGAESLGRADRAWQEEWAERRKRYPHVKWRVIRRVWAVCGGCGAGYGFDNGAFHPESGVSPGPASAA